MHNSALIVLIAILMFGFGFSLGRMTDTPGTLGTERNGTSTAAQNGTSTDDNVVTGDELSAGQRQVLTSLGIDADRIVITQEMMACAEAELGTARMNELRGGAVPTPLESASLIACYR